MVGVGEAVTDWIAASHWIISINGQIFIGTADTNARSLATLLQARTPVETGRLWMLSLQNQTLVST